MTRRDDTAATTLTAGAGRSPRDLRAGARERKASIDDLREMISDARQEIVETGRTSAQRNQLSADLREVLDVLAVASPDLLLVRDRWQQVRSVLGPDAGAGAVAQITDLLIALFGSD